MSHHVLHLSTNLIRVTAVELFEKSSWGGYIWWVIQTK